MPLLRGVKGKSIHSRRYGVRLHQRLLLEQEQRQERCRKRGGDHEKNDAEGRHRCAAEKTLTQRSGARTNRRIGQYDRTEYRDMIVATSVRTKFMLPSAAPRSCTGTVFWSAT